jgi:hypothetical protein
MLGQPGSVEAEHLEHCAACRAELVNVRQAVGEFRSAVRSWSEQQAQAAMSPVAMVESRSWIASHQFAMALALAAMFLIASVVVPWYENRVHGSTNDAALLNQVDAQVSRSAPSSLEPLMKLVVVDTQE